MPRRPSLPLILGLSLCACDDPVDLPSGGTLTISTSTAGDDPDPDGFQLTIDGSNPPLPLLPSGTAQVVNLSPGRHTLQLLGVADHCSVAPGTSVEVDITAGRTTTVAYEVNCPLTGARITVTTTGLDLDPDGYRVVVDGSDREAIVSNGTVLTKLEPGSRTVSLTDLASNCAVDGLATRTVTIVTAEVAPIEFVVVCTAATGVVGVVLTGSGAGAVYTAAVDGAMQFPVGPGRQRYQDGVPAGDHVISLKSQDNCSAEPAQQSVTVTAGGLVRDTVEVTFAVTCVTMLEITAPTTGTIPADGWRVWLCYESYSCYYHFPTRLLGILAPNGTLIAEVDPGTYWLFLDDLVNCRVTGGNSTNGVNPKRNISVGAGQLVRVEFAVECS